VPRYRHYLESVAGGRWPTVMLVVGCRSESTPSGNRHHVETERLAGWCTTVLVRSESEYRAAANYSGRSAAGFWDTLKDSLRHPGTTWLLSYRAARVWALLGLWEAIEDERLCITGSDPRASGLGAGEMRALRLSLPDPLGPVSAGLLSRLSARSDGCLVTEDPPNIAQLRYDGHVGGLMWVDSRNYGVSAPDDIDPGEQTVCWLSAWFCEMASVLPRYNMGSLQATAGSQAMHGFRAGYLDTSIYCHTIPEVLQLEGDSYYGGRCECYRIGISKEPLWHLDFRSMYPAICAGCKLPARLSSAIPNPTAAQLERSALGGDGIARVRIGTPEPAYPVRRDGNVLFPVGRFDTVLAGIELADAWQYRRILSCSYLATYHMEPCLRSYASALYALRCEAEQGMHPGIAQLVKRLLVSLPGKLGQRERRWVTLPDRSTDQLYGEWYGSGPDGEPCRYRSIGGIVQRDEQLGFAADAVPAIAAFVCAYGRHALLTAIRIAGYEHVYYVDTDALIVDQAGYYGLMESGMVAPKQLGKLQVKEVCESLDIRGIKYYVENGRVVCAGLPAERCQDIGDGAHYWYYPHPGAALRSEERPEAARVKRTYERPADYSHGVVQSDGRVKPLEIWQ
jgi:hypothetical protein